MVIGVVLNKQVIGLIYGDAYFESSAVLSVLSLGVIFSCMNLFFGSLMIAISRQKITAGIVLAGGFANIVLDYFLIVSFGFLGAAIGTLIVTFLTTVAYSTVAVKLVKIRVSFLVAVKLLVSIILGAAAMHLLSDNFFVALIGGCLAYGGFLILSGVFTKEEFLHLKDVVSLKIIKDIKGG